MKLHQTPKLPGDVSTAAASMVLQLELGPGSKFECFKLLNSPVSAIYLVCPRSIAVAPGAQLKLPNSLEEYRISGIFVSGSVVPRRAIPPTSSTGEWLISAI